MKVWVVLPAFDEAKNLPALLPGLAGTLNGAALPYKIVVVDDGSQDGTRSLAEAFRDRFPLELVCHQRNRGLARTLAARIAHAPDSQSRNRCAAAPALWTPRRA